MWERVEPPTPYITPSHLTIDPKSIDAWRETIPMVLSYQGSNAWGLHASRGNLGRGGMQIEAWKMRHTCKMRWACISRCMNHTDRCLGIVELGVMSKGGFELVSQNIVEFMLKRLKIS